MSLVAEVLSCRGCGRTDTQFTTVSEHYSAQGVVSYVRCECGTLQVVSRSRMDGAQEVLIGATRPAVSAA